MASTYKKILDQIAQSGLQKTNLQLSAKVTRISTRITPAEDATVQINSRTGDQQEFDEVVSTLPLGYLKRHSNIFDPPLSSRLQSAISHISYGRLEKVYITFQEAYWSPESNPNAFFTQFLHPTYATKTNPHKWAVECVSLASLPGPCRHPTLLFYIHGPCAEYVTSLINGLAPDHDRYLERLRDFFEPYYSLLPNYSPTQKPLTALATDWQHDELAGNGSYTNFQVAPTGEQGGEEVLLDQDIEVLRYGEPERHLWFAGEHTAPFVALGTVTGAYWSGEMVARRILEAYGLQSTVASTIQEEKLKAGQDGKFEGTGMGEGLVGL